MNTSEAPNAVKNQVKPVPISASCQPVKLFSHSIKQVLLQVESQLLYYMRKVRRGVKFHAAADDCLTDY